MKKTTLLIVWGALFALCAGLGFLSEPEGALAVFCFLLSLIFFVPGGLLLWQGYRGRQRDTLRLVRWISLGSLGLTLVLLVLNVVSVLWSQTLGTVFYALLVLLSTPMVCSRAWVVSLFLWACLLMVSLMLERRLARES